MNPWPNKVVEDAWKTPFTATVLSTAFVAVKLETKSVVFTAFDAKNELEVAFVEVLFPAVKF